MNCTVTTKIRKVNKLLLKLEEQKDCNKAAKKVKKLSFDNYKYSDFLIANELWKRYITQLIEPK